MRRECQRTATQSQGKLEVTTEKKGDEEKGNHELNLSHGQSLFVCAMIWEFSNTSIL